MRINESVAVLLFLALPMLTTPVRLSAQNIATGEATAFPAHADLPLSFERNDGQTDPEVKFLSRGTGYVLFLTRDEAVFSLRSRTLGSDAALHPHSGALPEASTTDVLRMKFRHVNKSSTPVGEGQLPGKSNYFIGNDPTRWRSDAPAYAKVRYRSLYKNIDLVYHGCERNLEYDYVIRPGGNAASIQFSLDEASWSELGPSGELLIRLKNSSLRLERPVAYQFVGGERRNIEVQFLMLGGLEYGFKLGDYDHSRTVVVDPVLVYSTYLGGSNDEGIFGIGFDAQRNIYIAGETSSVDFPTQNALQSQVGGSYDAFVSKFDASGKHLVYSTYLGGSDYDHAVGIRVDGDGNTYVAGLTSSKDFPVKNALQTSNAGGSDGFIARLNSTGSTLVFSTYLGGSGTDQVNALALGPDDSIYVAGFTSSSDFPTTPNAMQTKCDGGVQPFCIGDGFVARLGASGQRLLYSTFVGGSSYDSAAGIAVDPQGNAYVAGQTSSSDFPVRNAYQPTFGGIGDAFVVRLNAVGSKAIWATFLGGSNFDNGTDVAIDRRNNVYVAGITASTDFPLSHAFQNSNHGGQFDGFVSKLNEQGSRLMYSTFVGGSGMDYPFRIAVSCDGQATIVGFTSSTDFPLQAPLQATYAGGNTDGFLLQLSLTGDRLRFSTYLGGTGDEYGYALSAGCDGRLWVGGSTSSTDFPLMNPFQSTYGGGPFDAFLSAIQLRLP
jgi:Beta-propeller repeat